MDTCIKEEWLKYTDGRTNNEQGKIELLSQRTMDGRDEQFIYCQSFQGHFSYFLDVQICQLSLIIFAAQSLSRMSLSHVIYLPCGFRTNFYTR